jgi:hypothetical protein
MGGLSGSGSAGSGGSGGSSIGGLFFRGGLIGAFRRGGSRRGTGGRRSAAFAHPKAFTTDLNPRPAGGLR